jgi:hypothetical protein
VIYQLRSRCALGFRWKSGTTFYREFFNAYSFLPRANRIAAFRITDVWTHLWLRQQQ